MLNGCVTFIAACKDYFGLAGPNIVTEFKALTHQDKVELRDGLIAEGYDIQELKSEGAPVLVTEPALVGV